jgi:hypothetical protein
MKSNIESLFDSEPVDEVSRSSGGPASYNPEREPPVDEAMLPAKDKAEEFVATSYPMLEAAKMSGEFVTHLELFEPAAAPGELRARWENARAGFSPMMEQAYDRYLRSYSNGLKNAARKAGLDIDASLDAATIENFVGAEAADREFTQYVCEQIDPRRVNTLSKVLHAAAPFTVPLEHLLETPRLARRAIAEGTVPTGKEDLYEDMAQPHDYEYGATFVKKELGQVFFHDLQQRKDEVCQLLMGTKKSGMGAELIALASDTSAHPEGFATLAPDIAELDSRRPLTQQEIESIYSLIPMIEQVYQKLAEKYTINLENYRRYKTTT